ncbi:TIGR01906 family membrane protein [Candidatus Woesearchaeota archaeon]|nr:TIGR01906 family membrane protein [Candidatus Woesearchaeota archaeon]
MIKKIPIILAVFLVLILLPINLFSFDEGFYHSEFSKYGIYSMFNEDINSEFNKVLVYLDNGDKIEDNGDKIEEDFFNDKEREHLKDVRILFVIKDILIFLSVLTIFISGFVLKKNEFLNSLNIGGLATLIFIVILGLFSLFNFDSVFIKFHEIFFNNNLWLLNPETDNLIILLPQEIFFDILKRSLLLSFILSLIVINLRKII